MPIRPPPFPYTTDIDPGWLGEKIRELALLAPEEDAQRIKLKLQEIVPEYQPFDFNSSHQP